MPKETKPARSNENDIRVFDGRAFLFHHRHLQSRPAELDSRCGFCSKGLEGVVITHEVNLPEPSVVQDNGTDTDGGPSSPSLGDWASQFTS